MNYNFLICSERSGSNLISKLIGEHKAIISPPVAHFFRLLTPLIDRPIEELKQFSIEVFKNKLSDWRYSIDENLLEQIDFGSLKQLVCFYYQQESKCENQLIDSVFVKEVRTYKFTNYLRESFPASKFVWLYRDPRDMALSWKRSGVHRGDVYRAANVWMNDQKESLRIYQENKNIFYKVSYEQLTNDNEYELNRIFNFLGHDGLNTQVGNESYSHQASDSSCWKNLNKPVMKNSNKFLTQLSLEEIFYIEELNEFLMSELGYERVTSSNQFEFSVVEEKLKAESRHEKEEYWLLSGIERQKQKKWIDMYQLLPGEKI